MRIYDALRFVQGAEINYHPVSIELRNRVRYRLSADAVFAWEGAQQTRLLGGGVTRDISVAGAFVFTSTCPPVGATIELDVFLSPAIGSAKKGVRIKTEATVIRVEHSAVAEGFAVVSQDLTLLFDSGQGNAVSVSSTDKGEGGITRRSMYSSGESGAGSFQTSIIARFSETRSRRLQVVPPASNKTKSELNTAKMLELRRSDE
jgi:hypothetical protein